MGNYRLAQIPPQLSVSNSLSTISDYRMRAREAAVRLIRIHNSSGRNLALLFESQASLS